MTGTPSTPSESPPIRLLHVINNLHMGGAETVLVRLLSRLDRRRWSPRVISLIGTGPAAQRLQELEIPVTAIGMRRGVPGPRVLARLAVEIRNARPQLVQTWLYHANLLGGLASRLVRPGVPVVWNLRNNGPIRRRDKASTYWTSRACATLSRRVPERILVNSQAGRHRHTELGYDPERMEVIANGFDVERFRPSETARAELRRELGVGHEAQLVGMAARFNPQKDFEVLMAAAAGLMNRHPDLHMLLCGPGIGPENRELADVASAAGCGSRLHLMGLRDDMPRWQAALDVATLASYVEGIPNTIGEAMACGVPCVVTDVGGAGELVGRDGKAGRLVPIRDAVAFETAIDGLLSLPAEARRQIGAEARRRIAERFSIETMVERFEATWTEILSQQHSTQTRQAA